MAAANYHDAEKRAPPKIEQRGKQLPKMMDVTFSAFCTSCSKIGVDPELLRVRVECGIAGGDA
jgi:hypothetical protein